MGNESYSGKKIFWVVIPVRVRVPPRVQKEKGVSRHLFLDLGPLLSIKCLSYMEFRISSALASILSDTFLSSEQISPIILSCKSLWKLSSPMIV